MSNFTFSGTWHSDRYPNISGKVSIDLPYMYGEFDTELRLSYNDNGESHTYALRGLFGQHNGTEQYTLIPQEPAFQQLFMVTFRKNPHSSSWIGCYTCVYPYGVGQMTVECETTCQGCLEDQPNQLAHMECGGCLYEE